MNLKQYFLTENECYKKNVKITVKGLMLHSTGANNPNISRYVPLEVVKNNHWNKFRPDGRQVCVHGFIGKLENGSIASVQTLPWAMKGWHSGGAANNNYIGVEICEDGLTDRNYFNAVYQEAVELFAMLCKEYKLNPLTDIICHSEGFKKGIASNHSDVMHWFPKHGKSMDIFRNDVNELVNGSASNPVEERVAHVTVTCEILNIRSGAGALNKCVATAHKNEEYDIYEIKNNWGRTNKGWFNLNYTSYSVDNCYPACDKNHTSIVQALNSIGVNSSYDNRKKIAQKNNVNNYSGTAKQNNQLLDKLKAGRLKK